jgi:hypothetical protein
MNYFAPPVCALRLPVLFAVIRFAVRGFSMTSFFSHYSVQMNSELRTVVGVIVRGSLLIGSRFCCSRVNAKNDVWGNREPRTDQPRTDVGVIVRGSRLIGSRFCYARLIAKSGVLENRELRTEQPRTDVENNHQ